MKMSRKVDLTATARHGARARRPATVEPADDLVGGDDDDDDDDAKALKQLKQMDKIVADEGDNDIL